jgi:hypothetical protein
VPQPQPALFPNGDQAGLGVWDTGTGAFVHALQGPDRDRAVVSLLTYQGPSDGRPRVAASFRGGHLCIFDGDDFRLLQTTRVGDDRRVTTCLAVYEEPTSGRARLVTG